MKSTFTQQYKSKVKVSSIQKVALSNDNSELFVISSSKSKISDNITYSIGCISALNGKKKWSEKINNLAKLPCEPSNILIIEELNIALIMGKGIVSKKVFNLGIGSVLDNITSSTPTFYITAIDLTNKKHLWTRVEKDGNDFSIGGKTRGALFDSAGERNNGGFSIGGLYLTKNKSFLIKTPSGLEAFDVATGSILWSIVQKGVVDFGKLSQGLDYNPKSGFIYLESMDRLLFNFSDGSLALLNQYEGSYEWEMKDDRDDKKRRFWERTNLSIGSIFDADIFEKEGLAVFYGPVAKETNRAVAPSKNRTLNNTSKVLDRVSSGLDKGIKRSPLFLVDLENGDLRWESKFMTNGRHKLIISQDRLLVNSIVTTAFDLENGEKTWQNVPEEELNKDSFFGLLSEFTGIDYTTDRAKYKEAVVFDEFIFTVFPEVLEKRSDKKNISIRLYDFITGEMLWKTDPMNVSVRDFFFESGILFVIVDGRFSRPTKILAFDPNSGQKIYEINNKDVIREVIVTQSHVICWGAQFGGLDVYDFNTGARSQGNLLPKGVVNRIKDLNDHLFLVYNRGRKGSTKVATYDRNSLRLLKEMSLPFYSDNIFTINDKVFMLANRRYLKGVIHLDLDKMEVYNHATITTDTNSTSGKSSKNQILKPYYFILSNDASRLFVVAKKKLHSYEIN